MNGWHGVLIYAQIFNWVWHTILSQAAISSSLFNLSKKHILIGQKSGGNVKFSKTGCTINDQDQYWWGLYWTNVITLADYKHGIHRPHIQETLSIGLFILFIFPEMGFSLNVLPPSSQHTFPDHVLSLSTSVMISISSQNLIEIFAQPLHLILSSFLFICHIFFYCILFSVSV